MRAGALGSGLEGTFGAPYSIASDGQGTFYVMDSDNLGIYSLSATGAGPCCFLS